MICPKCGREFAAPELRTLDVSKDPSLKESVKDGSLFLCRCPHCGTSSLAPEPVLYHDPSAQLLIAYTSAPLSSEGLEGYTCRLVSSIGELIEKVKIFDAGLDDIALEMAKFITRQELGKDVDLLFFSLDGADNEITLTYPEDGQMQLVRIGFNVYEDCAGILLRNPDIKKSATGLCRVDRGFVEAFLR